MWREPWKLLWVLPIACAASTAAGKQSAKFSDAVALLQTAGRHHAQELDERPPAVTGPDEVEEAEALSLERLVGPKQAGTGTLGRVLVFWAVGSKPRAIELVRQNIKLLRAEANDDSSSIPLSVDIFLAHYDKQRNRWRDTAEAAAWYRENVQYSVEMQGYKMKLANHWLVNRNDAKGPNITDYEWLWLLDEDADFSGGTKLRTLVREARASRAVILGPSVMASTAEVSMDRFSDVWESGCQPGLPMCELAKPDPRCRYRYTNFVEVMFTFVRPTALVDALRLCPDCLHEHSVWGLDKTWCVLAGHSQQRSYKKACAIVDNVQVIHENLKTLDKWKGPESKMSETGNTDVLKSYHSEMAEVERRHPKEFQRVPAVFECVPNEEGVS